ncbi:hypothetical protein AMTRI_Chr03g142610 [Amborella trichopoda]
MCDYKSMVTWALKNGYEYLEVHVEEEWKRREKERMKERKRVKRVDEENVLKFFNEEMGAALSIQGRRARERNNTTTRYYSLSESSRKFRRTHAVADEVQVQKPRGWLRSKYSRPARRVWTLSPQEKGSPGKGITAKK